MSDGEQVGTGGIQPMPSTKQPPYGAIRLKIYGTIGDDCWHWLTTTLEAIRIFILFQSEILAV